MEDTFVRPRMDLLAMTPEKEEAPSKHSLEEGEGTVWSSLKKTIAIITTTSVVLLAMRNTATYHLQHFWGASGNFWQHQWDKILDLFGHDDFNLFVYGPVIVSYIVYWGVGSLFILLDLTSLHTFTKKYKMQPNTNEPLLLREVLKTFVVVSFNQIFIGIPSVVPAYWFLQVRGYDRSPHLPTFHWVLFELVICIIAIEFGFYYAHRLIHHRSLYKHIHKIHHEWQSPIAISALYVHPAEYILATVVPIMLGPIILGSHPATLFLWCALATMNTLNAHCGYHLPFFPSPEAHDYHHLKFNQCYGVLGILDHLHGTNKNFRASVNYPRHQTFLTMTPPRKMFPDVEPDAKAIKGKSC
ncbi:fatty acid hydroxylase domain-containing protein 2-like [Macrobrachium nipponense]|uniref:fatty acid hydroxylase domain-containing protein 2-like n=1 Tax=Macrobrachium nipponense TaxID=159736 RepID=UPI0030C7A905